MKWGRWVLGGLATIVAAGVALKFARPDIFSFSVAPFAATCSKDDEIEKFDRGAIEKTALEFMDQMLGSSPGKAFDKMSALGKASTSHDQFLNLANQIQSLGPFSDEKVARTYFVKVLTPRTDGGARALCGTFNDPHEWDAVAVRGRENQGHVVITAKSGAYEYTFVVWLSQTSRGWLVNAFHANMSRLAGRSAENVWRQAQVFRAHGDALDAGLMYITADTLLQRGPNFQPGLRNDFDKDRLSFSEPKEMKGAGPYHWVLDDHAYTVTHLSVTITRGDGKLALVIDHDLGFWKSDDDADRQSRALLTSYMRAHPDWSKAFDALIAKASKPDHSSSYGTVYDKDKGFL
jgi:hypothetical protein